MADIVSVLFGHEMRHRPSEPSWPDRDRFILSKGHVALVQYAVLAQCGYFPESHLATLKQLGSPLQGHPDIRKLAGIEANTGSLGQGLSMACGMAAGLRLDGRSSRVFCVLGDGELAEGQVWEAALAASYYKLDNVVAILDKNGIQATGFVAERFATDPLPEKWRAFGWHVVELDGHSIPAILAALDEARATRGKPTILVAHTVKGKGISFAENNPAFHNGVMTKEQFDLACREVGR